MRGRELLRGSDARFLASADTDRDDAGGDGDCATSHYCAVDARTVDDGAADARTGDAGAHEFADARADGRIDATDDAAAGRLAPRDARSAIASRWEHADRVRHRDVRDRAGRDAEIRARGPRGEPRRIAGADSVARVDHRVARDRIAHRFVVPAGLRHAARSWSMGDG